MSKKLVVILLVLLFMYTGFSKLFALQAFTSSMYNQPIPHWLAAPLILLIPTAEVVAAGCLLTERTQRTGLYISFLLLTLFTLYVAAVLLHFFPRTPCTCGNVLRHLSWSQHLLVNLTLTVLTGIALFFPGKKSIPSSLNLLL
jgi:hypothetical protein